MIHGGWMEVATPSIEVFWEIWSKSGRRALCLADINDINNVNVLKFSRQEYEYEFYTNQKP